jgi:hypothetical protein
MTSIPPDNAEAPTPATSSSVSPLVELAPVQHIIVPGTHPLLMSSGFHPPGTPPTTAYHRLSNVGSGYTTASLALAMTSAHLGSVPVLPTPTFNPGPPALSATRTAPGPASLSSTYAIYSPVPLPGGLRIMPYIGPCFATSPNWIF